MEYKKTKELSRTCLSVFKYKYSYKHLILVFKCVSQKKKKKSLNV